MTSIFANLPKGTIDKIQKKMIKDIQNILDRGISPSTYGSPSILGGPSPSPGHGNIWGARLGSHGWNLSVPEDFEQKDADVVKAVIQSYFESAYPDFEPEIVSTIEKDYFLPALKVLDFDGSDYYSPQRKNTWINGELVAACEKIDPFASLLSPPPFLPITEERNTHRVPADDCDCGIYGSVNLEEIRDFLHEYIIQDQNTLLGFTIVKKLVIVEPSPDADIILARKGWKASRVFISEVVGDTISVSDASRLLSIAWHREIDVSEAINENR